jgi:hypothetical protein
MKNIIAALAFCLAALTLVPGAAEARHHDHSQSDIAGPPNGTVLIVRHAEKPASGTGLTPAGEARAAAYASYFAHFQIGGAPVHIDTLVATADSDGSVRPRLTLTPLSQALNLPIQQPFADKDVKGLAAWLSSQPGRVVLVAWHHGKLPQLLADLGADPGQLLPNGAWPGDVYNWVIELRYDAQGRLISADRVVEPADLVRSQN